MRGAMSRQGDAVRDQMRYDRVLIERLDAQAEVIQVAPGTGHLEPWVLNVGELN